MKKKQNASFLRRIKGHKLLLKMKLTFIILMCCLVQVSASVYSQTKKFSFDIQSKQVVDVLKEIEEKSDFRFFYQREQVDVTRKVDLKVNNGNIDAILNELFKDQDVSFKVMQDNLIIISSTSEMSSTPGFNQQQKSVSGKVTDSSGGILPGVSVVVKGTTVGTITDANEIILLETYPPMPYCSFRLWG